MKKNNTIVESPKIIRNRELNNKILDLESERHQLAMEIKKLQLELEKDW